MLSNQHGLQRLALASMPTGDYSDGVDRRKFQFLQLTQELILTLGHPLGDFLHGVDIVAHVYKADHVPGDASGQVGQQIPRPGGQRPLPRQCEHPGIGAGGRDVQGSWLLLVRGIGRGFYRGGFQGTGIQRGGRCPVDIHASHASPSHCRPSYTGGAPHGCAARGSWSPGQQGKEMISTINTGSAGRRKTVAESQSRRRAQFSRSSVAGENRCILAGSMWILTTSPTLGRSRGLTRMVVSLFWSDMTMDCSAALLSVKMLP